MGQILRRDSGAAIGHRDGDPRCEPFAPGPAVMSCCDLLALKARDAGVDIKTRIAFDLPELVADRRAFNQILINLISNAIKFTPQGGEIWLKVGWTASGGQYLSVKDTGPGIPDEEIPVVLSKFGQGSNAIKSAEQGTGLGLPIAKNIVEGLGGSIAVNSRPGQGTDITIDLPLTAAAGTAA